MGLHLPRSGSRSGGKDAVIMKGFFSQCHPAINLLYFSAVIGCTICFTHPLYTTICFLCAFWYSVKLNGWRSLVFNFLLLPCVLAFALYYSSYTHFGVTVLQTNLIGNSITLESFLFGLSIGARVAGVCIWFSCVHAIFTTDKIVFLFGTVSPLLSLFLAIVLRLIPRIKKQAMKIHTAQKGIGRGIFQGNLWQRLRNSVKVLSIIITWTIDAILTLSDTMRSRGSGIRGRTAFSIYRFDYRDRILVIIFSLCISVTLMAVLLQQTNMQYSPRLVYPIHTCASWLFYCGFSFLCFLPIGLEYWIQYRFWKGRNTL